MVDNSIKGLIIFNFILAVAIVGIVKLKETTNTKKCSSCNNDSGSSGPGIAERGVDLFAF